MTERRIRIRRLPDVESVLVPHTGSATAELRLIAAQKHFSLDLCGNDVNPGWWDDAADEKADALDAALIVGVERQRYAYLCTVCGHWHLASKWSHPRRLILVRHKFSDRPRAGGKKLIDVPGYAFQALVTSLPSSESPLAVWRDYNGRADCENVIKELQQGFALPTLCLRSFWATEAALCLATLTYNLIVLFPRHLGWHTKVTIQTLRFWLFITPGIIAHPAGKTTIKIAVPPRERDWWSRLWDKILSPFPDCNAVENRPAFAG